ncbi:MAG: hypothetical protein WCK78_09115 [Paludibacter sp.]
MTEFRFGQKLILVRIGIPTSRSLAPSDLLTDPVSLNDGVDGSASNINPHQQKNKVLLR